MAISAMPDGDVVNVPRSETKVIPKTISVNEVLGTDLGGSPSASAKGFATLMRSLKLIASMEVRTLERVPPLGPELL